MKRECKDREYAGLQDGDVVAVIGAAGEIVRYTTVTKAISAGLIADGNVYNAQGKSEVGNTTLRAASEAECLVFQIKNFSGRAWSSLGVQELRGILDRLEAAAASLKDKRHK